MLKTLFACLLIGTTPMSQAAMPDNTDFLKAVKEHYQASIDFKKYAIHYSFEFERAYQAYNYLEPHAGHTAMYAEVDLGRKLYADHSITSWPGGFVFDFKEFQTDAGAFQYDVNGLIDGKRVRRLGPNAYTNTAAYHGGKVDFLAILPLLETTLASPNIKVTAGTMQGHTDIVHTQGENSTTYTFTNTPIQLVSIHRSTDNTKINYGQYVNRGNLRYASLINQENLTTGVKGVFHIAQVRRITNLTPEAIVLPKGYGPVVEKTDRTLKITNIADGLHLITDDSASRNMLAKTSTDGIMVFGAPIDDELSEETIALIRAEFPSLPIKSVYITHPHSDHIGGLTAYAKHGITILADTYSIEAIKAYPRFQKDIGRFKFQPITHKELLGGVEFHILENSHAKGQSFAYFPEVGVLYEGDFLEIPYDNSTANHMPVVSKNFIEYVNAEKLNINRIVGHHRNNNISAETMNELYRANTD